MKKMLQDSMDGPSVNWKLYDSIVEERNKNDDYTALIDIGSCSLHVVHGTFRSGVQKTNVELMVYSKPKSINKRQPASIANIIQP